MAENYFNYTPENNLTDLPQFEPEMPIKKFKNVSNIIKMYPSKDADCLKMLFPFQIGFKNHGSIISLLLRDKRPGSLYSVLKDKQYITHVHARCFKHGYYNGFIELNLGLTQVGYENYETVIAIVHQFFDFLKTNPIPQYIIDEEKLSCINQFKTTNRPPVSKVAQNLASNIYTAKPEQILSYGTIMHDFDYDKETQLLQNLKFEDSFIILKSQKLQIEQINQQEHYSECKYAIEPLNIPTHNQESLSFNS